MPFVGIRIATDIPKQKSTSQIQILRLKANVFNLNCLHESQTSNMFTKHSNCCLYSQGFIRMVCCQSCKVEYHINCWKKLKATAFSDKNEKVTSIYNGQVHTNFILRYSCLWYTHVCFYPQDFLQGMCFTPDCEGRICHIKIYGSTGLVKCEVRNFSKVVTLLKVIANLENTLMYVFCLQFEASIDKPMGKATLRVNQKCTR